MSLWSWIWEPWRRALEAGPGLAELVVDDDGWLQGEGVEHVVAHPSWHYRSLSSSRPLGIVAHYTATEHGTALAMARRRTRRRRPSDRAASWHISIEGDGSIIQMISTLAGAWHCSRGHLVEGVDGPRHRINRCTVGIELVSPDGRSFPPAQVESAKRVWRALVQEYDIGRVRAMLEHSTYDPARRRDPGPVWMEHAEDVLKAAGAFS